MTLRDGQVLPPEDATPWGQRRLIRCAELGGRPLDNLFAVLADMWFTLMHTLPRTVGRSLTRSRWGISYLGILLQSFHWDGAARSAKRAAYFAQTRFRICRNDR